MRRLTIAILLICSSTYAQDQPKELVLLSYCTSPKACRFTLLSLRQSTFPAWTHVEDKGDFPNTGLLGVSALKQAIEKVPRGSVIEWRGWKPAGACLPPQDVVDDIKAFVASHGIELRIAHTPHDT